MIVLSIFDALDAVYPCLGYERLLRHFKHWLGFRRSFMKYTLNFNCRVAFHYSFMISQNVFVPQGYALNYEVIGLVRHA